MDPRCDVHDPGPLCADPVDHCAIHGVDEPIPPGGAYLVCAECGHMFASTADLLAADAALVARLNANLLPAPFGPADPPRLEPATDPMKVTSCPHCGHEL